MKEMRKRVLKITPSVDVIRHADAGYADVVDISTNRFSFTSYQIIRVLEVNIL